VAVCYRGTSGRLAGFVMSVDADHHSGYPVAKIFRYGYNCEDHFYLRDLKRHE